MLVELLLVIVIFLMTYAFHKWATINHDYFKQRGIKALKPCFLIGNTGTLFLKKQTPMDFCKEIYNTFPDEPLYGMFDFRMPQFVVRDAEVLKRIAVKDFDHFEDHNSFTDENIDPMWGNSLLLLKGAKWRDMRATLSPAFTGSKMRQMFELVSECAEDYVKHFQNEAASDKKINIEVKDIVSRYTVDVIATCAFGLKINSLANQNNEFFVNGKQMTDFDGLSTVFKLIVITQMPKVAKAFDIRFLSTKLTNFFKSIILDTMNVRKSSNIHRPDMINLLLQVREGGLKQTDEKSNDGPAGFATVEESDIGKTTVNRSWSDDEIVAQCFLFFVGGFETSSTNLMFDVYELVANQDIQQKLYEEIAETNDKIGGKRITYDQLQKMKYLDQIICESLRKWPPLTQSDRLCIKDYVYDDGNMKFNIEKGRTLLIPTYGFHHDEKYFPNPDRFDPERFSDENKQNIAAGTYIPFGIGPRNCIGSRFALMQIKALLYYLLLNFSFEANENTEIPIKLKKTPFNFYTENGVHIELKPRQK